MPNDHKSSTWAERRGRLFEHATSCIGREMQIEDDDEMKGANGWAVLDQVRLHPFDVDARPLSDCRATVEGDPREIHRGDLPSLLRQPDGVAALARGQIEGSPRL